MRNPNGPASVSISSNDRRLGKPLHAVCSAARRRLVRGRKPIAHDREHHHRVQFGVLNRSVAHRAVRWARERLSPTQANALGLESGVRKTLAVALFAFIVASGFAQEAAKPKPAPERNNGAFIAIFCSFIAVGVSVATAINASRAKDQKAKTESQPEPGPASE